MGINDQPLATGNLWIAGFQGLIEEIRIICACLNSRKNLTLPPLVLG